MIGSFVITAVQKWIAGDKHYKVAHLTFRDLATAFAAAVEANDGEGLGLAGVPYPMSMIVDVDDR